MDFDTCFYLKKRFCDPEDKARGVQPFLLESIHDFYAKFNSSWAECDTVKVLEFGGGPVLYSLISASPHVSEITFADYSNTNLKSVELWRDDDPSAHDWAPYIAYVISKLEGCHDNLQELVKQRTRELRRKIKHIVPCDIFDEMLVNVPHSADMQLQYDIVSTHFCLDVVTETINDYKLAVKRMSGIIKPGGFLHSLVSLEESYWLNGNERCSHLYLTKNDIISAYEAAGLSVVHTTSFVIPEKSRGIYNDCKGVFHVVAHKLN